MPSPVRDAREELFVEAARRSYRRLRQWQAEHPTATLGEIEQQARAERRLLMGQLIPLLIGDRGRDAPAARPRCPHCGKRMSFQEDRSVPVETLEGAITLKRPYYYCRSCHEGLFPLDQALHLRGQSSEGVQQAAVESGALLPSYDQGAEHFTRLTAVPMDGTTLRALVQEHGGHLAAQEAAAAEKASAPPERDAPAPGPQAPVPPERVAFSQDGTTIHTYDGWKEVKESTISEIIVRPAKSPGEDPEVHLEKHSYCAGLWDHEELNRHFWWDMQRRQADRSPCQVAIGDAAPWIWENFAVTAPTAEEGIDWWHALDYFWGVAKVVLGEGTAEATAWMAEQETALWHGDLAAIRAALAKMAPATEAGQAKVRCAVGYLTEHAHRLRYPEFRAAGYPLGSGTAESGCKTLVGGRMKQAGQRWSDYGGNAVLAIRDALWSDRWLEAWPAIYWSPPSHPTTS